MNQKDKMYQTALVITALHVMCGIIVLSILVGTLLIGRGLVGVINVNLFTFINIGVTIYLAISISAGIKGLNSLLVQNPSDDETLLQLIGSKSKTSLIVLVFVLSIYAIILSIYPILGMIR
jgi:hypothetical protein